MAIAAAPAAAQTAGAAGQDDNIIVTASRAAANAHEIGSSVTVITAEQLQQGQTTFVKDALQDVPGITVSSDRPGDFTNLSIRGSNNDEVLWLIDGIELGDPSSTSTQYQSDHLITADIDRIEVLRGNQSSLYGSDAIGGVVNIITKRATEDGLKASADVETGSYKTINGGASLLGKSGPVDFRVTATGYQHDGPSLADPRTGTGVAEDDTYWRYGFSGRVGLQASSNLSFQAVGFWLDSFSDLDGTTGDTLDTVRKEEYAYAGQGEYRSSDNAFTARATASRYVAERRYFGTYNRPEGDTYEGTKDALSLDLAYDTGNMLSVAVGGNLEWEDTDQITNYTGNFVEGIDTKSGYGEIALRPVEGLTVTAAARVDDNSRFGTFDTYRGTAAYVIGPVKLRASYGTGAKAPGLYQLFDPTYGNPDLRVEESRGGDVGFDVALGHGITAQASYFFLRKKDEIVWDGNRGDYGGYDQYARTRAKGVELGVTAQPADFLRLSQSFTYTDHETDPTFSGTYVDSGRPKYLGTTSVTVLPVAEAEITVRARYRDGDETGLMTGYGQATDDYVVVDLLGSFDLSDNVQLYGRIVNLFDKDYQVAYGKNALGMSAYGGIRVNF